MLGPPLGASWKTALRLRLSCLLPFSIQPLSPTLTFLSCSVHGMRTLRLHMGMQSHSHLVSAEVCLPPPSESKN